jgi:succinate dehydrogenase / fumarate reductase cytochrome b subunit
MAETPMAETQVAQTEAASCRPYKNALGVWGWLGGGRWGIERYAYALHRLSGLAILLYLLMHIFVTALRVQGVYLWLDGRIFDKPAFRVGEFLVFAAFVYHACNGVRLVLVELGIGVGKPCDPVYPYKTSLNVQRPLLIAMMILAAILLAAGGVEFLGFVE